MDYAQPITKVPGHFLYVNVLPVSRDGLVVNLIACPSLETGSTLT